MKRTLPLISLLFVSFFVCLCATGLVFILSVDAHTAQEKTQSVLTLGLPFALALIALLWFGAGIDFLLSRIKDRSRRRGMSVAAYLILPIGLCVGVPALVAAIIYGSMGSPIGWKQLPAVPESPLEVAAADELSVIVRTNTDAYYSCVVSSPATCWETTIAPEQSMTGRGMEISTPPYTEPPGEVVSMLGLSYMDMGEEGQVHYALLEDGSVWVLQKDANKYEAGFATGLFLTIALIPAAAGLLVIYLGAGISALARWVANSNSGGEIKKEIGT
jgi:hypothetical protein